MDGADNSCMVLAPKAIFSLMATCDVLSPNKIFKKISLQ